jgi:hypothetical protein
MVLPGASGCAQRRAGDRATDLVLIDADFFLAEASMIGSSFRAEPGQSSPGEVSDARRR